MMVTRGKSKKFSITKFIHEVVVKPKEIPTSRRILVATHSFSFSLPPHIGGEFLGSVASIARSLEEQNKQTFQFVL